MKNNALFASIFAAVAIFPMTAAMAQTVEGATHGVWQVGCDTGLCQAFLAIEVQGEPILSWTLAIDPDRNLETMLLRVPVETALPPGIRIWPGDSTPVDLPFQVCTAVDCLAVAILTDSLRASLSGSETARVSYIVYGESEATVFDVPLAGFEDAMEALSDLE